MFSFVWIFILFLIQNALHFSGLESAGCLVLIGVVFYALWEGPAFGMILGCYAGVYEEIFSLGSLGESMALLALVGLMTGLSASKIFRESFVAEIILPVIAFCGARVLPILVSQLKGSAHAGSYRLEEFFSIPGLIGVLVLSPLVFWFLKKVSFKSPKRVSWV